MAQRVTLAQTQLQIAQSNPQLHNIHEAYRRVYEALGTKQIDTLLKPAPKHPEPLDPAKENVLKENKTLMQSARFIQNKRVLVDPEARAFAKQLFVQDPEFTTLRLIENTVPVAEFARRFGAQGQGISEVIKDIRKFYSSFGDINVNRSLQKLVNRDIKAVEDTVNAYFGVYRAGSYLNQNDFARSVALTLQTLLSNVSHKRQYRNQLRHLYDLERSNLGELDELVF